MDTSGILIVNHANSSLWADQFNSFSWNISTTIALIAFLQMFRDTSRRFLPEAFPAPVVPSVSLKKKNQYHAIKLGTHLFGLFAVSSFFQ